MARIRTIKPEFWRDEDLSTISAEAALLAIGLLNQADDEGYFNANSKLIESDVFPLRELSCTTTELLNELHRIGYVSMFYGTDSKRYGHIVNFEKHQVINKKNLSKIKPLLDVQEDYGSSTVSLPVGKEQGKEREHGKEQGTEVEKPRAPRFDAVRYLTERNVSDQVAIDWIAVRKMKRSAVTQTSIDQIERQARKANMSLAAVLTVCCQNGWAGFNAEWVNKDQPKKTQHQLNNEAMARSIGLIPHEDNYQSNEGIIYDAEPITPRLG
jgi:hypothetical protein